MRFIAWFLVYWGLNGIAYRFKIKQYGGIRGYDAEYEFPIQLMAGVIQIIIFFWLWNEYVKGS